MQFATRPAARWLLSAAAALVFTISLAACDTGRRGADSQREGDPRPFEMGLSSLPSDLTDDAYRNAFRLASTAGEVVLIQRTPPWADFVPGATISDRTTRLTRLEKELAKDNRLKIFFAIDPTDPRDRGRLAGLPDELRGGDFADNRVRTAFIAYAKYIALNYKPAYLALGSEVDMVFNRIGDASFRSFQSLYFEAYDAVKSVSSSTLVFPTFQLEDLQGLLNTAEKPLPTWPLLARFEPKIDMIAVTSYPEFAFLTPDRLPAAYFSQLLDRTKRPIALVGLGWEDSSPPDAAADGSNQSDFVKRVLGDAELMGVKLIVWTLGRDPTTTVSAGFDPLAHSGLFRTSGKPKVSWEAWRSYSVRPFNTR